MSAARRTTPPPDMTGVKDDWQRAIQARKRAENPPVDEPEDSDDDATTPRGHDATTDTLRDADAPPAVSTRPRASKGSRQQAPRVADALAMTVRVDRAEAADIDRLILDLRDETGQRLDKAEVVRELLRLAQHDPAVRRKLVRRLR
jgi:hypothetical protein